MPEIDLSSTSTGRYPEGVIHVLHVEPDEEHSTALRERFDTKYSDFTVATVSTIGAAIAYLGTHDHIDCVVSEHQLSDGGWQELLKEVNAHAPTVPVVLFTGETREDVVVDAITAGVTEYVHKHDGPVQFDILANRIRNVVAQYRAMVQLDRVTRETEKQFQLLVDSVDDYAIFLLDEEGFIKTWNRGAEKIKGYSAADVVGEHFSLLYAPQDIEAGVPMHNLQQASEVEQFTTEGWRVREDGSKFWAHVVITALREDGELTGFAKITRDMTDVRRREELVRQNEFLQEFAGTLAHDLLNPLTVAQVNLHRSMATGDIDHLETVDTALTRTRRLIEDLLELARKGELIRDPEPTDLREVATSAWEIKEAPEATLEFDGDLVIDADEGRLRQLFENLFRNAVTYCQPGVTVRIGPMDGGFYVEDDGGGITDETKALVFNTSFTTSEDGSGFGLAIVKQIATAHGWSVTLTDSEAGGARFEFTGLHTY
ncbi:PAS domain S-box protein [Haloarchaeobius sp. DT45]|uniref:two-component system sensor histidine kinase NtrB n=1 Tax=Haloarchaeobius sp. DT45 TaxID=3446116 RepID=UPI003F6AE480